MRVDKGHILICFSKDIAQQGNGHLIYRLNKPAEEKLATRRYNFDVTPSDFRFHFKTGWKLNKDIEKELTKTYLLSVPERYVHKSTEKHAEFVIIYPISEDDLVDFFGGIFHQKPFQIAVRVANNVISEYEAMKEGNEIRDGYKKIMNTGEVTEKLKALATDMFEAEKQEQPKQQLPQKPKSTFGKT